MIEVIPFSSQFQSEVVNLILPIQREEFGFSSTLASQPDLLDISNFYQSSNGGFWIALDRDELVGTVALRDFGESRAALRKMFVKATHRGKMHSVASLLFERLKKESRGKLKEIFLGTTDRYVAAHRFYEKNGFVRIGECELPATFPRLAASTRFYHLTLPE